MTDDREGEKDAKADAKFCDIGIVSDFCVPAAASEPDYNDAKHCDIAIVCDRIPLNLIYKAMCM